ncbi:hypothetical protein BDB00DRAFT_766313 [Zychaea mexicana]|uniref:uncharacterized protein n=1 Tax=Zychaea mexicana TaxID=64656 RepID=UPI0022FE22E2|nr:uncharacterized protein BDB00DRAFT_766313 [Zychaea mexicana]KAI9491922.1 hypothetical protein BDB00DRAFT_766313 [Zychaea mexicana]
MPHLSTVKVWLHLSQIVLTLLTICTVAPVIATEIRFYGGSQAGPNWTLVVAVFTIWIPLLLVYFPWAYDRKNKFKRIGKFCLKPRTNLIFTGFCSLMWAAAGIAMAVHANNPEHCNVDSELADSDGDYASAWSAQCNCAKAAAGFSWITCFIWIATLICSVIIFWNEKQLIQKNLRDHERNKQEAASAQQDEEMAESDVMMDHGVEHEEEHAKYQVATAVTTDVPQQPQQQQQFPYNTYYHQSPTPPPHQPGAATIAPVQYPQYPQYRAESATPPMTMPHTQY